MPQVKKKPVVIAGGGPAGSVAALCLRKLGHEVVLFERQKFPRYRIGESLLPGTMSILTRLGVADRVIAANFTKKRAATFIWGGGRPPWSFTFATPKTAPWTFDHSYQVTRAEFDQILLDAARERGADVRELHEISDFELGDGNGPVQLSWKNGDNSGQLESDFFIDATGASALIGRKYNLREWDQYYRNTAVWGYWKGGKRYKGDLEGNIFSVSFEEGWMWIIPLKDDLYSVGVVTDVTANEKIREMGAEAFYLSRLEMCDLAKEILATATRTDEVRVLREWSYDSKQLSMGRAFMCGDSGCFIDPLFSQGVHLATYSGMMAAAAIDYLYEHPEDTAAVHEWYEKSYRMAYQRYHKFLAGFYACNGHDSPFWRNRRIAGADDQRFAGKDWFATMTGQNIDAGAEGTRELEDGAAMLATLWQHRSREINDEFDETELQSRRLKWGTELLKQYQSMAQIRWRSHEVRLIRTFKVHPTTFKLEHQTFLGNEHGQAMTSYTLTEEHRKLFESLAAQPLSFNELTDRLKDIKGGQGTPFEIVRRLFDDHFLEGRTATGEVVHLQNVLRFGGVGADDDIS
jgi:flavin-dependent dehydrogenase